ncbi:MAG: chorismate synthase [Defluviitaleaceae bacterium]|nr:chorismate synthase [Defluviitaleaceae bacterium]
MSGSIYGKIFKVTTWGESHGAAIGAVIDGCPSGLLLSEKDIQIELDKRKPSNSPLSTIRKESDKAIILSGVFEGKTTGTPISVIVFNEDARTKDYSEIKNIFRPGHADYTFYTKYGVRDYRGGGRSSGRETVGRVIAGAIAKKILKELGIEISAYSFDLELVVEDGDSVGGIVECVIKGVKAGIGETVFDKLDAELAKSMLSIGAVKGIEFGAGFKSAFMKGSENNDEFFNDNGKISKLTNNSGGILAGMSDGSDIVFRLAFKPTPSISKPQKTVDIQGNDIEIEINGRHDVCIVPRAIVVVEAMAAITLTDLVLRNLTARMDNIKLVVLS